jgi:hypothetical protein
MIISVTDISIADNVTSLTSSVKEEFPEKGSAKTYSASSRFFLFSASK